MDLLQRIFRSLPDRVQKGIVMAKHRSFRLDLPEQGTEGRADVQKTILILGMHRSGTSLTGEILKEFGVNLGEKFLKPEKENPRGFFENLLVVRMNDKILALAGGTWDRPPARDRVLSLMSNKRLMDEIQALVSSHEDVLWGWKDPRTVLTIDLFLPFLKNPYFIFCHRDENAIAKSINKRNGTPLEQGLGLARHYKDRMAEFAKSTKSPSLHLHYEDYFKDPKGQFEKIRGFLGFTKNVSADIIDRKLKHF